MEVTMTSAAYRSAGTSGRRAEGQGFGLVIFAAVLLGLVGFFNLIDGIAAIANSHVFVGDAHYVFGNLRTWGWITLIIAVDIIAIWGLCAYGSRENIEAAA
jgi:hypothetical protein